MLFYLSCLLKASLSFIILTKFITEFTVDTSLIVFVSLQIILLDYIIFKDNDIPASRVSFSISYLKKLEPYLFLWRHDDDNDAYNGGLKFKVTRSAGLNKSSGRTAIKKNPAAKLKINSAPEPISSLRPGFFTVIMPFSILSLFCGSLFFFVSPLYSHEYIVIPDLKGLKPYSAETNFMSFDGYLVSYFKIKYNKDISRGEAHKIIKGALKNKSEYVIASNDKAIAKINSVNIVGPDNFKEKYNECIIKLQNTIQSLKIINGGQKRYDSETPPFSSKNSLIKNDNAVSRIVCVKTSGWKSKSNRTKRAVILPFKNKVKTRTADVSDDKIAFVEGNTAYSIKNYLSHKGFSVISGADVAGVCFNLDNLDKSTVNELAAKFSADYIVTGSIDADLNAYLKVIEASSYKVYNSFDCLN